jgi:N-acetylmuramoyl-L-alanine amidase
MKRREFLKYLGASAPYQQMLLNRWLAVQAPLLLAPLLPWGSLAVAAEGAIAVTELKHWSTPDYTRVSIALEKEVKFESHKIPGRLYLDIAGAKVPSGIKDLNISDGLLKSVRIAQFRASTVRVVLDLDSIKDYKIFTFADPYRIIIDVKGERRQEISSGKTEVIESAKPETVTAEKPKTVEKQKPVEKAKTTFKPGKIRRIVVDPGHGGHDPGAMSPSGTREKDIVLQIGLKLSQKIREELGIDVVMTRSTDVFIELQERTAIANKVGADLFVSIHANASLNRAANRIATYYLNLAKTEKAAHLAAKENGTTLEKVSVLQAVLFDLMANYKLNDSAHLADDVQKALYKKAQTGYPALKNLGVKQGPFYVLVGATMPSILVETAFVSNERDEVKLKDPAYQDLTAEGILSGIKGYIASLK